MATDTVLITHVTGKAWMRNAEGQLIALHDGMRVPVNAHIMTDEGASVTLQATGVPPVIVGQNTDMLVSEDLAAAQPQPADNAVTPPADPVADQILAALDAGQDPFAILDPTAAVLTGGGGGGDSFTRLASITETTTPLALAYPRPGVETPEIVQLGGVAAAAEPAGPTIDVSDDPDGGEGGPDVPPGVFSIPENNTEGGVSGSFAFTAAAGLNNLQFTFTPEAGQPGGVTVTQAELNLLSSPGTAPIVIDTEKGSLTLTGYDPATGTVDYTYRSDGALDHPLDQDALPDGITIIVNDSLGRSTSADLVANITDTVPVAVDDANKIGEDGIDGITSVHGNVLTIDGATAGDHVDDQGADGSTVTGIQAPDAAAGETVPASGTTEVHGKYGDLTIDAEGHYTYTLATEGDDRYLALQALSEGEEAVETFKYTLTDGDGDTSQADLVITVTGANDGVTVDVPPGKTGDNDQPVSGDTTDRVVYESGLPSGSDPRPADLTAESHFTIKALDGLDDTDAVTLGYTDAGGNPATLVLSKSELEALGTESKSVDTQYGTMELHGYSQAADGTITIDYTYTLVNAPEVSGIATTDGFTVVAKDADGDTDSQNLGIRIVDDAPTAHLDVDNVAAGQFTAETGNVITGVGTAGGTANADVQGADGAHVSAIASNNVTGSTATTDGSGNLMITGQYGVLTIGADGGYSYVRSPGTAGGGQDVFTYTLSDGDTDTDTATLTINIGNSVPTLGDIPAAGEAGAVVSEAGLPARGSEPAGSHAGDGSATTSGTISFTSLDGLSGVSLGGQPISSTDSASPTDLGNGLSAYYTYDVATGAGTIHYSYTLPDNTSGDDTSVSFDVQVSDADSQSSGTGHLVIDIVDDVPEAHLDVDNVAAGQFTAETGNVITGVGTAGGVANADVQGADGAH
ncbi:MULTISPECIES: retention module-containing protein, partial [Alcaligenaceae]|uniref:retention module-containing protein n=1 Tax=Alcaligenaceae TaxID=506 RepID=UPI003CFC6E92